MGEDYGGINGLYIGGIDLGVSCKAADYDWLSKCTTGFNVEGSVTTCNSITAVPYEYQTTTIEASPWNGTYVAGGTDYIVRPWEEAEKELTEILSKGLSKQIDDEILKMIFLKRYEMKHGAYYRRKYLFPEIKRAYVPVWKNGCIHADGRYVLRHR